MIKFKLSNCVNKWISMFNIRIYNEKTRHLILQIIQLVIIFGYTIKKLLKFVGFLDLVKVVIDILEISSVILK